MQIRYNGEWITLDNSELSSLLISKGLLEKSGIAVAINNQVIPKSEWESTHLQINDEILIITAAAGG
ncbi:MAG: sulfur carrier protein ThiS [Bacteroidetes bacterium]|nr:sulfur carrier protein ThiS [Bacteroidota bacterium]